MLSEVLASFGAEKRYGAQLIYDSVTQGQATLVHRWYQFEEGYDIHIENKDINLYSYLREKPKRLMLIGFLPQEVTERFDEKMGFNAEKTEDKFLQITTFDKVITLEEKLIFRNVKGQWLTNFDLISLTDRRNNDEQSNDL